MQAVEDNISLHNEAWAVEQILKDEETDNSQMSVLEVLIRDALPDLLQDWMDKNLEQIATEMIKRDALHDAVAQLWSKRMKNSS
jgi:cell pole-organizing protein PopZ